jgi:glycosyltransferase involved in cell wall biosynthesis
MKTIVIAHNYSESSFASMSYHLSHHLASLGNRVVFISHYPYFSERQIIEKGKGEVIVCSWPSENRPTTIKDFFWFAKLYLKYKPEVVIGHFVGSNITVSVSKILSLGKVKTIEYYHTLSTQILKDLGKLTLKQRLFFIRKRIFYKLFCDLIICPSEMAKNDLEEFFGIQKGLVVVNPMVDRFKVKTVISFDAIVVSYLGRLDSSKGVIELIFAFEAYKKKFKDSKIILNIAGTGSQQNKINLLANNNDDIHYWGGLSYDKIDGYLNECHFTIIPSKFDNLPTVGLEAMMNQTPLLISNTTGLAQYLTEGKECFKFDPNIESMIALFDKVERNFNFQEQMSVNARSTFITMFTMKSYCDIFSKIIG